MTWTETTVGRLIQLEYGAPLKAENRDESGAVPVAGSNGVNGYHSQSLVKGPGIVVGRKGSAGKITWYQEDFWPIDTAFFVKLKLPIDLRWSFYLLSNLNLPQLAIVTGVPGLNRNDVYSLPVQLPTLREQRRIVELLEQADGLRRKRAETDVLVDRIIPAIFHKMFGDPLANDRGWPTVKFGEIAESRLGKMLDSKQQTGDHARPYLRNLNVQWARFDLSSVLEMDFPPDQRNEFLLKTGDLLICEGGEVGRSAIWGEQIRECYFQKALHRVRPHSEKCTAEFLLYLLWALAKRGAVVDVNSKATIAHLTGVQLAALRIPLPPLNLQQRFAGIVQSTWAVTTNCSTSRNTIETLFQTILYHAFTGELTAKWREAHINELLAEMEHQARLLEPSNTRPLEQLVNI